MRPVDLMPPEDRRGSRAPMRAGGASYVLIAALALGLLGVIALALTGKQVSDKTAEKQQLEQERATVTAKADSLRAFSDFHRMQEERTATVASLAQSRFDWERVLRELALVIPDDAWLLNLTGTVNPAVDLEEGADIAVRDTITGPALELIGCVPSEDALAGFIAAVEDIDGVTRVGLVSSGQAEAGAQQQQDPTLAGGEDECRTRPEITKFEVVVAFDAVPVPPTAIEAPGVPAPLAPGGEQPQLATSESTQNSAGDQASKAEDATNLVPGG